MLLFFSTSFSLFSPDVCLFNEGVPRNYGKYQTFFWFVCEQHTPRVFSSIPSSFWTVSKYLPLKKVPQSVILVRYFTSVTVQMSKPGCSCVVIALLNLFPRGCKVCATCDTFWNKSIMGAVKWIIPMVCSLAGSLQEIRYKHALSAATPMFLRRDNTCIRIF